MRDLDIYECLNHRQRKQFRKNIKTGIIKIEETENGTKYITC